MSTTPVSLRTRQHQEGAWARLSRARRGGPPRAPIAAIFVAVAAMVALAIGPSSALADSPIQNPFFKDPSASGANSGTDLSGWATSAPGQVISTWCYVPGGINAIPCAPEQGTTIPVLGLAGAPTPPQAFMAGGQGTPGAANKTFRSTDIYSGDADWLAGNPFGKSVIPQQSNYALIPTSCQNNQPAPNTMSQSFYAYKDQVLTGFSFFTSQDWVPDSGKVTITPPGGSPQPLYQARITGDSDQAPAGAWDHPVAPTVHQLNNGTWVQPHGQPADSTWISQHQAGVSGTPWTRWTYRFPQDGTYTLTATANENTDPAFPVDCNMPSMMGLQFQTPTPIKDGVTVNVTPTSVTYGDAPFSVAGKVSVTPSRGNQPYTGTPTFSTTDPDCSVTSGGTVTVRRVGDGVCNVTVRAPGDYFHFAAETKNLPITINPRALHIDAPDLTKTYGTPNPDPTPQATLRQTDLVSGDTLASVLDLNHPGQPACSIDGGAGPDVGAYAATIHCGAGSLSLTSSSGNQPNYSLQPGRDGTLTITPADQAIILPPLTDRTYGAPDVDPSGMASSGLPVGYGSATDGVCTITPNGKIHIEHAGTCAIVASQPGNGNYNAAQPVAGTFNVAKADQAITFAALSDQNYGDPDPTADAHASSGLDVSFSSLTPNVCSVDSQTGQIHVLGSGSCAIVASQGGNDDYNAAPDVMRMFNVTPGGQSITFPAPPDKTWGDQDIDLTDLGATSSSGLPVSYTATGDCQIVGGKLHVTGAGSCTVTASQAGDSRFGAADPVQRTFAIHRVQLTVKADDQSKTYGDPNPNFTYGVSGFVNGDTLSSATSGAASCSSPADQGSGAGTYGISCGQGNLQVSPNYNVSFVDGTLTVNKAQLTVKADDQSKTYGDPDPNFTYGITGFVNNDTEGSATNGSASCSSNAGQGVGSYAINCSQGTLTASNYSLNFSPGTLTVNKAQLTVKADDKSKTYGDANPSFTYGLNGLVNGDTASSATTGSASCSTNAGQNSDVGTYAITCAQGSLAASNYTLSYSPGTLTVNKANQSINFGPIADKFFGQDDFNAGATANSGLPVTYAASGDCSVDPSSGKVHLQLPSQWPGNCTITASQSGNNDYNAAQSVSQSFRIATSSLAGGGIFDIGNLDASIGNNVNWWGSQWAKQNDLTGGSAPDAFKGFIDNISSYPPQCGTTWTTRDGNSSKPPASVPQYMTVVVSSNVSKSGPTISGDVQSVVVVRTNAGYDSNPGHWGTGTVVAKLCGQKLNQSITFNAPASKTVTDPDFDPGATASSGLPVSYASSTPNVCTIVGGKVHIVGIGNCTITASQGGNDIYSSASDVSQTFAVSAFNLINCGSGDKKKATAQCESLLVNPSPGANATVRAGQRMTIGYTDDSAIPTTGSLAPTAVLSDGRSLPVTVTPTSGLAYNYVTNYKQDRTNKYQALLSFQLPSNLSPGSYSILVTANDGDGDVDQWNWPVTVVP